MIRLIEPTNLDDFRKELGALLSLPNLEEFFEIGGVLLIVC